MPSLEDKKIIVTGGAGFLGSYVVENLIKKRGLSPRDVFVPRQEDYNLCEKYDCERLAKMGYDIIIHLAAKVGGTSFLKEKRGEIIYDNVMMGFQLVESARRYGVEKVVVVGTANSYPEFTAVPFKEENLWLGYPAEANASYGLAKGILHELVKAYRIQYGFNAIYLLLAALYGPRDHFVSDRSQVIPASIKKVADAHRGSRDYIEMWGNGSFTRDFLYVEDAAEGIVLAAEKYNKSGAVNIGSGRETSIKEMIEAVCHLMNFKGEIRWDNSKSGGLPRCALDISRAEKEFGFRAQTVFEDGLKRTIEWYSNNIHKPF